MILALQCCPHDSAQALELTRLICDIEPAQRADDEFYISARRDTPQEHLHAMSQLAADKFHRVHVIVNKRPGVGWPEGPNDLWAETMLRVSLAKKDGRTNATGVLTFEADCVPLRSDWIDVLRRMWQETELAGKDVCGHAHGNPPDHINGNAIFRVGLMRQYPQLNGSDRRKGWDAHHGELLLRLGMDTDAVYQLYGCRDYDRKMIESVRKNGKTPALLHGLKGMGAIHIVREMFAEHGLQVLPEYQGCGIRPAVTWFGPGAEKTLKKD